MSTTKVKSKKKAAKIKKLPLIGPKSYFAKPWQDWLCIGLIAFLCYAPILQNDFVGFDDPALITNNPVVTDGDWSRVWTWGLYSPYYKPLVFTTWKIEKTLFGFNPFFFHLNNLLLHLFNCLMVYLIVGRLCQFWENSQRHQFAIAFWTSFAFALHPMHVESVAWAVERKDVLFAAFFFVAWYCYMRYVESEKGKWMAWTVLAYLCSMLCKAPGIMLVVILFLYDFLAKRSWKGKLLIEKIPVMATSIFALYYYGIFHKFSWYTRGASGGITGEEAVGVGEIVESSSVLAQLLWVNFKLLFW
ncbi:MAG: hypothetical protein AAF705_18660, partial [Bacteroidota bacterium]